MTTNTALVSTCLLALQFVTGCAGGAASRATSVSTTATGPDEAGDEDFVASNPATQPSRPAAAPAADDAHVRFGAFTIDRPVGYDQAESSADGSAWFFHNGERAYIHISVSRPLEDDDDVFCSGFAQGHAEGMLSDVFKRRVHLDVSRRDAIVSHPSGLGGCVIDGVVENVDPELRVVSFVFKTRDAIARIACIADAAATCEDVAASLRISRR